MTAPSRADERTAWIALAGVDGLGEILIPRLAAAFGSAAHLLEVAARLDPARFGRRLRSAAETGLRSTTIEAVQATARDPEAMLRRLRELDAWALTPWDIGYPDPVRVIDPSPPVLFGTGDPATLRAEPLVAVVGTRRPTPAGRALAGRVAAALAERGVTVVSGLAFGIDGIAHAVTLETGGRTLAVIGGGLTYLGPRAHRALAASIRTAGGAIVGEHPPDSRPTQGTFPRRNRIISGLCRATLVIEAPISSGALITARHALEQGRAVFAAPGRPGDGVTAGCLALLRETPARPLVGIDELLVDLDLGDMPGSPEVAGSAGGGPGRPLDAAAALAVLGPVERAIAARLLDGPVSSDVLVTQTGQSPAVVAGALTLLQLRGWVIPLGPLQVAAGPLLLRPTGKTGRTHRDPP
jgi:DNA processing protein